MAVQGSSRTSQAVQGSKRSSTPSRGRPRVAWNSLACSVRHELYSVYRGRFGSPPLVTFGDRRAENDVGFVELVHSWSVHVEARARLAMWEAARAELKKRHTLSKGGEEPLERKEGVGTTSELPPPPPPPPRHYRPNELCAAGIRPLRGASAANHSESHYRVCCEPECGVCGGEGCSKREGGRFGCCTPMIRSKGMICRKPQDARCVVPAA
eukprot:7377277-Prymnesium_polylepis.1